MKNYRSIYFALTLLLASAQSLPAQAPTHVELLLSPVAVPDNPAAIRLLPSDPQLTEGNAAVVLLRMIWEQQNFMQNELHGYRELVELEFDDPRIQAQVHFDFFQGQMSRAAYMRSADWNYPLHEEPLDGVLLPDVQGLRQFADRGLGLWIKQRIHRGLLAEAREGILVQLACARHISRTPLFVNQLVGGAIAHRAVQGIEILIQQPQAENLYWAIGMLPDTLGDTAAAWQWEALMLRYSLPHLRSEIPALGDDRWSEIAEAFELFIATEAMDRMTAEENSRLQHNFKRVARRDLMRWKKFDAKTLVNMSDEELVSRWAIELTELVMSKVEAMVRLEGPFAIEQLAQIEQEIADIIAETGAPAVPFIKTPSRQYFAQQRFNREMKLLQVVEAVRDHAAVNGGRLPTALADMRLPAPLDPLTLQPFHYEVQGNQATLYAEDIEEFPDARNDYRDYRLRIRR